MNWRAVRGILQGVGLLGFIAVLLGYILNVLALLEGFGVMADPGTVIVMTSTETLVRFAVAVVPPVGGILWDMFYGYDDE